MRTWFLKVSLICFCIGISIFFFTTHLQAHIQLEFSDIDYDEAQYIKFIIDADKNFDIVLYMKDNDNNTFRVRYQTENDEDTGDYKDDNNDDELAIFLDEDEYVTGHKETFNSYTHSNSFSLDEYINTHWKERDYNGGSAELEYIQIQGDEFKLYYIAIDDGDFTDPTWELDVSEENWDSLADFENDGHSLPDLGVYSTTTTDIAFLDDYIHVTIDFIPGTGYAYYGYLPSIYWNQPYNYGWNQPYGYDWGQPFSYSWNQPPYGWDVYNYPNPSSSWNPQYNRYGYGWNQPYNGGYYLYHGNPYNPNDPLYGTVAPPPISIPSGIMNMMASSNWNTAQMGIELSQPYFQAAARSGWTPWSFPSGFQPYYGYGGYPWGH